MHRAHVMLRVRRQDSPEAMPYFDEFRVTLAPRLTIAEALDGIALHPMTTRGERVTPIAYTWGCAGLGCVSCMLVAARRPVAACETLLEEVVEPGGQLVLEPLGKLGVIRDLLVDSGRLRNERVKLGGFSTPEEPASPLLATDASSLRLSPLGELLSRCTRCGACVEACPETRAEGGFVGAAAFVASQLADARDLESESAAAHVATSLLATARATRRSNRHLALAHAGGIHECGDAQRCLAVCPVHLPLDEVLGRAARDAIAQSFRRR